MMIDDEAINLAEEYRRNRIRSEQQRDIYREMAIRKTMLLQQLTREDATHLVDRELLERLSGETIQ